MDGKLWMSDQKMNVHWMVKTTSVCIVCGMFAPSTTPNIDSGAGILRIKRAMKIWEKVVNVLLVNVV